MKHEEEMPEIGARIVLCSSHPWGGNSGEVIRHEHVGFLNKSGKCAVVHLDNGIDAGVVNSWDWVYARTIKKSRRSTT